MNIGDVAGTNARPSWKFFYDQTGASEPTWNFKGKFLVDRNGKVSVPSSNVEADIVALLDQQPEL
jgi:glutathione peroxidase-family protein